MAKQRKKLSDKLEKIMVQATLMGLTTSDMITISNRMKALERERELKADIDAVVSHFTYVDREGGGWVITDKGTGKCYHTYNRHVNYNRRSWNQNATVEYDVTVEKPGTRFHPYTKKSYQLQYRDEVPARLLPENSKDLYALMRGIKRGSLEKS